jgi:type VI secretion system protein ImpG
MTMDPRLLRAYNDELAYLRESAREFGVEHDVVAGYLGLKTPSDPDPYVERLLEGVAFLAARVNLKLQDQFPEFTQHLLQAVQPNYLAPTPSMCVVGIEPREGEDGLVRGLSVARETEVTARAKGHDTPVRFRTGQEVRLYPLEIAEAEYLASRTAVAPFAAAAKVRAEAGLRIRFRSTGGVPLRSIAPPNLPLFLAGSETVPGELYRQIVGETVGVIGWPVGEAGAPMLLRRPEASGFAEDEALLPFDGRSFRGYRILSEYFACPERFLFVSLNEPKNAFAAAVDACDIILLFNRSSVVLDGAVTAANFRLFATPAINLFEMQLGRVPITPFDHEHLVMPDRTRPLDFEVFKILAAVAHGKTGGARIAAPLYAFGALLYDWQEAVFYVTRLVPRRISTSEQRRRGRADYVGTNMYVSLTCPGNPERLSEIRELAVHALVTNRELPELLRFGTSGDDFQCDASGVGRVDILRAPTRPRPPLGLGDAAWRVIGHLTPNFASLAGSPSGDASILRDHLALYGRADDPAMRRQIDGILSVSSKPVTRRIEGADRIAFARGRRVRVRLDDAAFDNGRMFLFASIIDRFLSEFSSVNSFIETVFDSPDQGEFSRWPPRTGLRPTI